MVTRVSASCGCQGFTYVEVLVALAIFTGSLASLAQLSGLAVRSNLASRDRSYETRLATQKLAELQAEPLESLTPSSADAWMRTTAGAMDALDQMGRVVSGTPLTGAVYVRRWSVLRLPGDTSGATAVQVSVERLRKDASGVVRDAGRADVVRVVAMKSRLVP